MGGNCCHHCTTLSLLPKLSDISLSKGTFCEVPISLSRVNLLYCFAFLFVLILLHTCRIIEKNGGTPPLTYKKLCSIVSSMGTPSKPLPTIDKKTFDGCITPLGDDEDGKYQVPTLEELGIEMPEESSSVLFPGGETEALRRLDEHMEREVYALFISDFYNIFSPCLGSPTPAAMIGHFWLLSLDAKGI